jgi:hypothetical protein
MLAHDAKEDWFRDGLDYPFKQMIGIDRRGFPIVKVEAEFQRPSKMGDITCDFGSVGGWLGLASSCDVDRTVLVDLAPRCRFRLYCASGRGFRRQVT